MGGREGEGERKRGDGEDREEVRGRWREGGRERERERKRERVRVGQRERGGAPITERNSMAEAAMVSEAHDSGISANPEAFSVGSKCERSPRDKTHLCLNKLHVLLSIILAPQGLLIMKHSTIVRCCISLPEIRPWIHGHAQEHCSRDSPWDHDANLCSNALHACHSQV